MAIPKQFIEELSDRADIVDVVSKYVSLKKSGRNFQGLCPFHSEKTPSFVVSPDKQICHCFGCGGGGNPIGFIMKVEALEFPDAVRFLAKEYNMTVPEDKDFNPKESSKRNKILAINKETARFFYETLLQEENKFARDYLIERNIGKKTATTFGIGYAPKSFNALRDHLKSKGFYENEMFEAGVLAKNDKGNIYDKFRARVMFPIIDIRGNIIGFGGRVLDNTMSPKYLNSPDTPVFNKSNNLFAMNIAKKSTKDAIILAEGYMDVIALHKAGFDNAVASLGTALTDAQARLISRYKKNVIIAYDGDNAGKQATARAIEIMKKLDLNVKVLEMKNAKDPDEFITNFGKEAFLELLEQSTNDNEYKFLNIVHKYNIENDSEKLACVSEIVKFLSTVYSLVERDLFMSKISKLTDVSKDAIKNELSRYDAKKKTAIKKAEKLKPVVVFDKKVEGILVIDAKSKIAEEEIVSIIFTNDKFLGIMEINEERFSVETLRKVYIYCKNKYENGEHFELNDFYEILNPDEMSYLTGIIAKEVVLTNVEKAISDNIYRINERFAHRTNDMSLLLKLRSN